MTPGAPIRILGIDPGSRHTGYGVIETTGPRMVPVEAGTLSPPAGLPLVERLLAIHTGLAEKIAALEPHQVAVEDLFHGVNARSALKLAEVRGVCLLAAAAAGLAVTAYTPAQVKKAATGTGGAAKSQVAFMIARLLGLSEPCRPDAADALAVAVCHAAHLRLAGALEVVAGGAAAVTGLDPVRRRTRVRR